MRDLVLYPEPPLKGLLHEKPKVASGLWLCAEIDVELAEDFDKMKARSELDSLASEMVKETGRCGPSVSAR